MGVSVCPMATDTDETPAHKQAKGRRNTVSVRFSVDEKRRIEAAALADGLEPGSWMRFLALREARRAEGGAR